MRINFLALFVICNTSCIAQIFNGGFEQNVSIPDELGQWSLISGWTNAGSAVSSPDYYHVGGNIQTNLPETPFAVVSPAMGNAIVGMRICGRQGEQTREYLSTRLQNPLVANANYKLSFKVTNGAKTSVSEAGLAVSHLGVALTVNEPIQNSTDHLPLVPQFVIQEICASETWTEYTFTAKVNSPFRFLTIGLFGSDENHEIIPQWGDNSQFAYYFFDEIKLERLPDMVEINEKLPSIKPEIPMPAPTPGISEFFFLPNCFSPNADGSNDYFAPVSGIVNHWNVAVFSKWGDLIYSANEQAPGWDGTANGLNCPDGAYIWQLNFERVMDSGKKVPMEFTGVVNVIR
jgi:gliding motility-associated-like protein